MKKDVKEPNNIEMLAWILTRYDDDEPHNDRRYHNVEKRPTLEQFMSYRLEEHDGDCISQPVTCMRCLYETRFREAVWMSRAMRDAGIK